MPSTSTAAVGQIVSADAGFGRSFRGLASQHLGRAGLSEGTDASLVGQAFRLVNARGAPVELPGKEERQTGSVLWESLNCDANWALQINFARCLPPITWDRSKI